VPIQTRCVGGLMLGLPAAGGGPPLLHRLLPRNQLSLAPTSKAPCRRCSGPGHIAACGSSSDGSAVCECALCFPRRVSSSERDSQFPPRWSAHGQ